MALFSHNSNRSQGRRNNRHSAGNAFTRPGRRYGADMIGLGIFHDDYRLIANPVEAHNAKLQELITSLPDQVGGRGTNLTAGLLGAVRMADRAPAGCLRRVWVLSDGDPNTDVDSLYRAVDEARKRRININTIGFGNPGPGNMIRNCSSIFPKPPIMAVLYRLTPCDPCLGPWWGIKHPTIADTIARKSRSCPSTVHCQ